MVIEIKECDLEKILDFLHKRFQQLDRIEQKVSALMPVGDDILAKVTEADTKVDGLIAFLKALQSQGVIPPDVAAAIMAKIQGSEDKIDTALGTNTTPVPIPPTT